MTLKRTHASAVMLLAMILFTATGCETLQKYSLTYKLWNNSDMRSFAEPADEPRVELFYKKPDDVLVTYNEAREQDETIRRRAYFLSKNVDRIDKNRKPAFVTAAPDSALTRIDLLAAGDKTNSVPYAIYNPERKQFSVIGVGGLERTHELPVYRNSGGTVARTALTPLAVAGDATIVGLGAAFVAGYAYASGMVHH